MSRADSTNTRFIDTAEYRWLTYKMFRTERVFLSGTGGYLYRLPAVQAWRKTVHYVDAVRR
jgi:hypothetical protein